MQIGVSTAAYYGLLETEDAATRVASLGVRCCEVFLQTYREYSGPFGALVRERLGDARAVSVHSKTQHFETDFVGQSPRQRAGAYAMLEAFLDAAVSLGASTYVYHGPPSIGRHAPDFSRWQPGIAEAIARCAARGVALSWETVSWCWLSELGRVREFLSLWPDLRFVLDVKQVLAMGKDPVAFVDVMGDRLRHVHILDYDAGGRLALPGRGRYDFRDLARALRGVGYRGCVILEPYAHLAGCDDDLLGCVAWLREIFQAE